MLNRKNKKGFTLAELLIVVAIIAVLVAIAVPLFVGAVDKAEENVFHANMRSARSLAAKEILLNSDAYAKGTGTDGKKVWYVIAEVDAEGNIKIKQFDSAPTDSSNYETTLATYKSASAPKELKVIVKESEITVTPAGVPGA